MPILCCSFEEFKDYSDPSFVIPRVFDKLFVAFLMTTLYWGLGHRKTSTNVNIITALLFMWATLPGFTAVAYVPAIVLDKPLFRRQVHPFPGCMGLDEQRIA